MPSLESHRSRFRWCFAALGCLCVALGAIGFFVPVMPFTVFFLIALWAFARGSERLHNWLYTHRMFGPSLRAWREHRVIPARAKALAVSLIVASLAVLTLFVAES